MVFLDFINLLCLEQGKKALQPYINKYILAMLINMEVLSKLQSHYKLKTKAYYSIHPIAQLRFLEINTSVIQSKKISFEMILSPQFFSKQKVGCIWLEKLLCRRKIFGWFRKPRYTRNISTANRDYIYGTAANYFICHWNIWAQRYLVAVVSC